MNVPGETERPPCSRGRSSFGYISLSLGLYYVSGRDSGCLGPTAAREALEKLAPAYATTQERDINREGVESTEEELLFENPEPRSFRTQGKPDETCQNP
jgi:hypothetical protein